MYAGPVMRLNVYQDGSLTALQRSVANQTVELYHLLYIHSTLVSTVCRVVLDS